jgi:cytochrome c-type biogenesis protein CcmH
MLWFVLAGMTGLAALCALWPLAFRRPVEAAAASEVAFYKAQLGEIERDVERGQLPAAEAAGARAEAARRLIAASAAPEPAGERRASPWPRRITAILIVVVVPSLSLVLYAALGRPEMPDAPLASRQADAKTAGGVEAAIARIESHLAATPGDGKGWALIGPVYVRLGRFDDAVNAFRQALRLNGESAALRANYGEALVGAAGGVVTADARAAFDQALGEQPGQPAARFYLALAAEQDGDKAKATAAYQALVDEAPAEAPWRAVVSKRLAALKGEAVPPAPEAAAAQPNEAQQAMIQGMVQRLATRLEQKGGDAGEWQRLIRAYSVLHETDKAKDALAAARKALAGDAGSGRDLDALAHELGIGG